MAASCSMTKRKMSSVSDVNVVGLTYVEQRELGDPLEERCGFRLASVQSRPRAAHGFVVVHIQFAVVLVQR